MKVWQRLAMTGMLACTFVGWCQQSQGAEVEAAESAFDLGRLFELTIYKPQSVVILPPQETAPVDVFRASDTIAKASTYSKDWIVVKRDMRFDPKRQALRVVDIFTNSSAISQELAVGYISKVKRVPGDGILGRITDKGEYREKEKGPPASALGALIKLDSPDAPKVPFMLLWGQEKAKWPVRHTDDGKLLLFSYEGTIPAGGSVALVYWIATGDFEQEGEWRRSFDWLWKNGQLLDSMLDPELQEMVMNFNEEVLAPSEKVDKKASNQLAALHQSYQPLQGEPIELDRERDAFIESSGAHLDGLVTGDIIKIKLTRTGELLEYPLSKVAGIKGGMSTGREHKLFLRDGSVLAGQIDLGTAAFQNELGEMKLNENAVNVIVLKQTADDGKTPDFAKEFVAFGNGEFWWLSQSQETTIKMTTRFGSVQLKRADILLCRRQQEAPFLQTVILKNGSQIQGLDEASSLTFKLADGKALDVPAALLVRWGKASMAWVEEVEINQEDYSLSNHCLLKDGSMLKGRLSVDDLLISTSAGENKVKAADLKRLTCDSAGIATAELLDGKSLKGRLAGDMLLWQYEEQTFSIPSDMILEINNNGTRVAGDRG